jgi:hypothetical protein
MISLLRSFGREGPVVLWTMPLQVQKVLQDGPWDELNKWQMTLFEAAQAPVAALWAGCVDSLAKTLAHLEIQ